MIFFQMNFNDDGTENSDQVHDLYNNYRPGSLASFHQVMIYYAVHGNYFVFLRLRDPPSVNPEKLELNNINQCAEDSQHSHAPSLLGEILA